VCAVRLTLGQGAGPLLSGGSDFSVAGVHRIKEQPVIISSIQYQRLTAQDRAAVPLRAHTHTSDTHTPDTTHTHTHTELEIQYLIESILQTL